MSLLYLPSEILQGVLSFVDDRTLVTFTSICRDTSIYASEGSFWNDKVEALIQDKQVSCITMPSSSSPAALYKYLLAKARSCHVTTEEVYQRTWYLRFKRLGGGRAVNPAGILNFSSDGFLYTDWIGVALPWRVVDADVTRGERGVEPLARGEGGGEEEEESFDVSRGEGGEEEGGSGSSSDEVDEVDDVADEASATGSSVIQIANFPAHEIARTKTWGYVLQNLNVIMFTVDSDAMYRLANSIQDCKIAVSECSDNLKGGSAEGAHADAVRAVEGKVLKVIDQLRQCSEIVTGNGFRYLHDLERRPNDPLSEYGCLGSNGLLTEDQRAGRVELLLLLAKCQYMLTKYESSFASVAEILMLNTHRFRCVSPTILQEATIIYNDCCSKLKAKGGVGES